MALQTTGSGGLSAEMKTFYDRLLLERTTPTLQYTNFSQKRGIPKNGGKTVEFRKFAALAVATTPLTEGTPPTLKDLTVTAITATIAQYGDAVGFSDLVSTTTIDPLLKETTEILAEQAQETIDEICREVLVAGTTVIYANDATSRTTVGTNDTLTPSDLRRVLLTLKKNRARRVGGFYHAIVHPDTVYDLMSTQEWRDANQYAGAQRIFDGSIGTLYGIKFWETDKAKVLTNASNGLGATGNIDVYITVVFGQNAWGMIDLAGHNLRTYYKPLGSAGTADPVDQQQSMGWKVAFVAKILQDAFMARIEHAASQANNAS